ncbi:MAG: NAD-glutamate dehydrogenase domain-containing protein, partial [Actinomycetota bacterium]
ADGLNRLILAAGMSRRDVAVLRLYHRYLRQAAFAFSPAYIERAVIANPAIAADLTALFRARFDPAVLGDRTDAQQQVRTSLLGRLEAVPSLDHDRILRAFLTLIDATVRTNVFVVPVPDDLAVKLKPADVAFLPEPRPAHEIFVCSPWVEGVHLRAGAIARGGLRWSDRQEDFRTEILGLVKAQMVKNSVIVPVGAKGGFVVKGDDTSPADRERWRKAGVDRYRRFISALLDVTDNVIDSETVHPDGVVVHDDADPYLVVAADKGTATFSDLANEIAVGRDFWLGDAFASGGSQGYDHKAMGITARGVWESVRRHARVIGMNIDTDSLSAVGVGDMSGDVFGNGMLLSAHLRLVAAFDHRHVFLDPEPDPARSFDERRRLFGLGRSSWADYDRAKISPGGGVYPRSLKSIPISPEVATALGLEDTRSMRPNDLISAILRAPVDLLWNGGIGTYVKASYETHEMVGDRANDAVRVDAMQLRCRIVGEGGNLGFTQLARVELAIRGGLIYTDAIDNSAGVDCSDHEVNIKIALDRLVRAGDLTVEQRNELLAEMTDEVAELVLEHNRAQTLALMIARRQALSMVNVHARYLDALEAEGRLDRTHEGLPNDRHIAERQASGSGLRAPEFAVMIAYSKNADVEELLASDVPDDPVLDDDLLQSFPSPLRERFPEVLRTHRLRREIVATRLVNNMVNLAGISFDHRMIEDTGASIPDVVRAFVASRNIFGFREMWSEIDSLGSIELDHQLGLFIDARTLVERGTMWLLRHRRPPLDIGATIDTFGRAIADLDSSFDDVVRGHVGKSISALREERIAVGIPPDLAARSSRWPAMHTAFDIVELSDAERSPLAATAATYWAVFDSFDLEWLWSGIGALPRSTRWQAQARGAMRDDLMSVLADLARLVMRSDHESVAQWIASNERAVRRVVAMHTEIRRAETADLTTLSVAVRQLRNLTLGAAL